MRITFPPVASTGRYFVLEEGLLTYFKVHKAGGGQLERQKMGDLCLAGYCVARENVTGSLGEFQSPPGGSSSRQLS